MLKSTRSSPAAIAVTQAKTQVIRAPGKPAALGHFADVALRRGQVNDAVTAATRSLILNAGIAPWVRRLAGLLTRNRRWDLAAALHTRIAACPNARPGDSADLATALWNNRSRATARKAARQASILEPAAVTWILAVAEHHIAMHQDTPALRLIRLGLILDGQNTDAWKRRAGLAARSGTPALEARALRSGLLTAPADPTLMDRYARVLGQSGDWRDGGVMLRRHAVAAPDLAFPAKDQAWHHEIAGQALLRQTKFGPAIKPFQRALILHPDQPRVLRVLSRALLEVGRGAAAEPVFARSVLLDSGVGSKVTHEVRRLRIEDPRDFSRRHGLPYQTLGDAFPVKVAKSRASRQTIDYEVPERFILCMDNPRIINGMFWAIARDDAVLVDGLSYHQRRREDFGPYFKYVNDAGEILAKLPAVGGRMPGTAALLGGGGNYYHCVMDWFSRLPLLAQCPELADVPLIVSNRMPAAALEWLPLLGVDPGRLIPAPAPLFEVERLWIASLSHGRYGHVSPIYLDYLEHKVLAGLRDRHKRGRRRLFLSRHLTGHRHLANWAALQPVLDRLGFETVTPETRPLEAQLALFADAAVIVGTFGAGLMNIVAAPAGTPIVELTHAGAVRTMFPILAGLLELPFHRVIGQAIAVAGRLPIHHDFTIDPERLERTLRTALET
jgi:Tfp pilus assembly protein PilF